MVQQVQNSYYDDEIDLVELLKVIQKHIKMILIISFVALASGIIIALSSPKVYQAKASFFPPETNSSSNSYMSAINSLGFGNIINAGGTSGEMILELMGSRRMAKDVIANLDLMNIYQADGNYDQKEEEQIIKIFSSKMKVSMKKSNLITLTYEDENPQLAADIVNFSINNLDRMNENLGLSVQKPLVTVLDFADRPLSPIKPNKKIIILISFISGVIFSLFLAFVFEYFQKLTLKK